MSFAARSGVRSSLTVAGLVAGVSLGACAASSGSSGSAPAVDVRVLVRLVEPSTDAAAISAAATRHARVPVTYAAATSPSWHALALHCESAAQCDAALVRLRAAASTYSAVEIEGRRQKAAQ
jgi:hypothetical protein